jgi:hypothetical protein
MRSYLFHTRTITGTLFKKCQIGTEEYASHVRSFQLSRVLTEQVVASAPWYEIMPRRNVFSFHYNATLSFRCVNPGRTTKLKDITANNRFKTPKMLSTNWILFVTEIRKTTNMKQHLDLKHLDLFGSSRTCRSCHCRLLCQSSGQAFEPLILFKGRSLKEEWVDAIFDNNRDGW